MLAHVLVLIEDPGESSVICDHLAEEGYRCTTAETVDEAETVIQRPRSLTRHGRACPGHPRGASEMPKI